MSRAVEPRPNVGPDVPAQVRALEGTYTGAWSEFGIDDTGSVVERMAWTDVMTAGGARTEGDRAYVATTDVMTFAGPDVPPYTLEGTEGFYLTGPGEVGDYFIETYGQRQRLTRLADDVWTSCAPAAEQELAHLGFPPGVSGQHVVVKVVTSEGGAETHRISRVTTVSWTTAAGADETLQFVSLRGYHRRRS